MVSTVSTILESRKTKTLLLLMLLGAFFVSNDNNGHQILSPYHVRAFEVSPVTRQRRSACNAGKTRTATILAPTTALDMTSFSSSPMWNTRNSVGGGRDFYRILGVPKTAKEPEIKQAFRRLVKQYHPDANLNSDTTEQFQIINRAYHVLMDPQERRQYNARMNYSDDTPHFIISDFEDQNRQHPPTRRSSSSSSSSRTPFIVSDPTKRIFLTDTHNFPFRVSDCE